VTQQGSAGRPGAGALRRRLGGLAALLLSLSGCGEETLTSISGRLEVAQEVDFGAVALGQRQVRALPLRNTGRMALSVEVDAPVGGAQGEFDAAPRDRRLLQPGERAELPLAFAPSAEGPRGARLRLHTDGDGQEQVEVQLLGEGYLARGVPDTDLLDFGTVAINTTALLTLPIANDDRHDAVVSLGAPQGPDGDAWTMTPSEQLVVPGNGSVALQVRFSPDRLGPHQATVELLPCPTCDPVVLTLKGAGIAATLLATPSPLEFGNVVPQQPATLTTRITNEGQATVQVTSVELDDGTGIFSVSPSRMVPFTLPFRAGFDIEAVFTPPDHRSRTAELRVTYADPSWSAPRQLRVPLSGAGGGPGLEAVPSPLAWPRTAVGVRVGKSLVLRNIGRDPAEPLVINAVELPPGSDFALGAPLTLPVTLAPGKATTLQVLFAPQMEGRTEAQLRVHSNDPRQPVAVVPLSGSGSVLGECAWELFPEVLDFGDVGAGNRARLGFHVRNVGAVECNVANVRLAPGSDPAFAVTPLSSRMVAPGETLGVAVEFAPPDVQPRQGEVTLDLSSASRPQARVALRGTGASPCLETLPSTLDFGAVGLACLPPVRSVSLRNRCGLPLSLDGCRIGAGGSPFAVMSQAPAVLEAGAAAEVEVGYEPQSAGDHLAALLCGAPGGTTLATVPLSGHAQDRPLQTDRYTLPPQDQVDFLFVIDNSGSFTEEQEALSRNFDAFIRTAVANGIDYHLGVTTTGLMPYRGGWSDCPGGALGGEAGRLFPVDNSRPRVLTPQTPDVRTAFEENVKVGICHWWEEGLEAARLALSPPLVDHADVVATAAPMDGNAGFLREEARLYVLFVTDEDDGGTEPSGDFVRFLQGLKPGRPDRVMAGAIVGLPSCSTAPSVGSRYLEVVNALGGLVGDVCAADWDGLLQQVSAAAFQPQSTFPLTVRPDGREVVVRVNGRRLERVDPDGSLRWRLDATLGDAGAVVFAAGKEPGPGAVVELEYPVPCPESR